jgi:hypothetical protein
MSRHLAACRGRKRLVRQQIHVWPQLLEPRARPLQTAFADGAADSLTGSSGSDW